MNRLIRIVSLSNNDRRLLLGAFVLVVLIRLGLWFLPFRVWRRLLSRLTGHYVPEDGNDPAPAAAEAKRVAWAVGSTSRFVPSASCLTQAVAAKVLMNRRGIPSRLHIGVAKGDSNTLEAHAWVEYDGRVIIGGGVARYTRLLVLEEIL